MTQWMMLRVTRWYVSPGPPKIRTLKLEWKSNAAMLHMNMLPITNKTSQKYTTIMCKLT